MTSSIGDSRIAERHSSLWQVEMRRGTPRILVAALVGAVLAGCAGDETPQQKDGPAGGPIGGGPASIDYLPPVPNDSVAIEEGDEPTLVRVFYATDRGRTGQDGPDDFYGGELASLEYGRVEVTLPPGHVRGELESPLRVLRWELRSDPEKHVVLHSIEPFLKDDFFAAVRDSMSVASRPEALVFIHGYNVSFRSAARRAAQVSHDLGFPGVPMMYSWPSNGRLLSYAADEQDVRLTVPNLVSFLTDVSQTTGAERVHVIAHSMGSRALASAMLELGRDFADPVLGEVVFAAPDIDAREFSDLIAPEIVHTADRITVYASSKDRALLVSQVVHAYPRAGDSGDDLTVVEGVETIDASEIDTSLLGHSYFADAIQLVTDLLGVIGQGLAPPDRSLEGLAKNGLPYWRFEGAAEGSR